MSAFQQSQKAIDQSKGGWGIILVALAVIIPTMTLLVKAIG